ncbi:2-oxoglutarate and iron-dependent oxygenase JMJD4 [Glycine soja]|uniref:JmjC domain-containing protein 4 isoform A n=1 Tax=Glycine soja TaxID=3848 RepID=A0A445L270_GLYSO|nr:2-oxoglutarate and iron-dependent oxygenase JMJD4 [Glycine soja]RZC17187.1 JmjC domain-containing protein 4 isoform A [Glycine soja]RZC17190.1 JmjC domain-containing protein 4 isoform D [Glycine soja]
MFSSSSSSSFFVVFSGQNQKQKQVVKCERGMSMGPINIKGEIERVNGKELSYSEFVKRYMEKNQPVVLTGLMDPHYWRASTDWVTLQGQPNFQYFSTHFGASKVQVADCDTREFTDQKREEMMVSDFIARCLQLEEASAVQCYNENSSSNGPSISVPYLKDWHFVKEYPEYVAYITPMFFCDDWLNLYLDNFRIHIDSGTQQPDEEICCSDYRFVYMGVKGSWTPLHADVFRSYSWSANVCGKKRWLFLDPSQCHLVFDRNMKTCVYNIFDEVSNSKFPGFSKAIWLECTQNAGEIIFVPSGWYHQVHNLEDTISINHNWFNAYNLSWVWNLLLRDYNEAKEYIEDIKDICDDFEGLCQRNLAANTGMNFYDFFTFISNFALANLVLLRYMNRRYGNGTGSSSTISQHLSMNLGCLRKIASEMKSMHALEGNHDYVVDMIEAFKDPRFSKLCMHVGRTYIMIQEQSYLSLDFESTSMCDLVDLNDMKSYTSQIYTPEDLIKFIDNGVAELGDCFIEEQPILHVA